MRLPWGVVGWVDFAAASAVEDIERLAMHPKLVGLRPMIQDIADDDWMLRPDLTPAFEAMIQYNLTFDALVLPCHLSQLHLLLSRHPELRCVIDHGAKPNIANNEFDSWARKIAAVANSSNAYCKLSGLITEAGQGWTSTQLAPYVAHLVESFGAERLVWGSDWPVVTLAGTYENWLDIAASLTPDGPVKSAIFGANTCDLYRLSQR